MSEPLLERIVVPVASPEDAEATCEAIEPHLADDGRAIVVHVIEKAGGGIDKTSVEQREQRAEEIFGIVTDRLEETGVDIETRSLYGTDVVRTILDAATEVDASAIVVTPRTASRWLQLLTGDVTRSLVQNTDRPLLVVPKDGDS